MGVTVDVDDAGVTCTADGAVEALAWSDLVEVSIRTTDLGPFEDDLHWLLRRREGTVLVVPSEAEGVAELLDRLQDLPGFDNEAVIAASSSVENAEFSCWVVDDGG